MTTPHTSDIPIDQIIDDLLEGALVTDVVLGKELDDEKFSARTGDQPIALKLRNIYEKLGQPVPPELTLYEMFEVWLVPHRVSFIRNSGCKSELTSVGIQIEYVNDGKTCSVISLIPAPQFIHHGAIGFKGLFQGKVKASGDISPTSEDLQLKSEETVGKLSVGVSASGDVGFNFRAEVVTPVISAIGIGASTCEWSFDKQVEPLFGKDIETWAVLALPKRQKELSYRLRYYICRRTFVFPTRRQSKWVTIDCALA